ncbi:MAG: hypothetical protein FWD70_04015 [Desulfuromonadales bacterium]|nr:hypothetical protein [Desulfuromonadales bacterium]
MPFFKSKKTNQPNSVNNQGQQQNVQFSATGGQTNFTPQVIKCPDCGAPLEITDESAEYVTCQYCKTSVKVRQDTQAPVADADSSPFGNLGVDVQSAVTSALSGLNLNSSNVKVVMGKSTITTTVNGVPVNNGQINFNAAAQAAIQSELAAGKITRKTVDIRQNGVPAKGVILACTPTGRIVNGEGELQLKVNVTRPNGSTYEVNIAKCVPQSGIAFTVPGSVVHVYYMPNDEQNIVIGFYA